MTSEIDKLLAIAEPYGAITPADEVLFSAAMAEADAWHRGRNPRYAQLWKGVERPVLPVRVFKRHDLATPVDDEGALLSSSGTTSGTGTRVFFDRVSMERIRRAMTQVFLANRFIDFQPANFLLLSPDPTRGNHPGYATTFEKFTACAPVKERMFAVDDEGRFLPEVALATLQRWAESTSPVFVFGLTLYFEHLALLEAAPIALRSVRGLTGGGWKGMVAKLDRPAIVERLQRLLPGADIRDLFGLTEHPVHYISCALGRFHIPKYARVSLWGRRSFQLAEPREEGLIRLESPLFASLPSHDLLTEDLGTLGERCACGAPLPYLSFAGRLTSPDGTCAATV